MGHVIVAQIKEGVDIVLTGESGDDLIHRKVFVTVIHVTGIVNKGNDTAYLVIEAASETGSLKQLVNTAVEACSCQTDTTADKVVEVGFEVISGEGSFHIITEMVKEVLPVDTA